MMDISLFDTEQGTGFPLVLLHGNGEDSTYFAYQIEAFSREHHVYAVDTRGHGKTERGTAPFTIRQFAEDLLAFLDARGIDRADILGFSDGANIAMIFALRYPDRVRRLILNGGNLNPAGVKLLTQLPVEIGYRIARLFASRSAQAKRTAEMLGLMVNDPNIEPEALCGIHAPTLVIAGTRDMIRKKHTELIAARIPGARLVFLPGSHFIARENPGEFNRAVQAFLEEEN